MRLLSFGEIIWDVYPDGSVLGGAPLNFAAHAALWGCDTVLVSAVGADELGRLSLSRIKTYGVETGHVSVIEGTRSGACIVTLDANGVPQYRLDSRSAYDSIRYQGGPGETYDAIAFGTLALRYPQNRLVLDGILNAYPNATVFSDLNLRPPYDTEDSATFCLSRADIVKISDEDARYLSVLLFGEEVGCETLVEQLMIRYPQIRLILVTKGANGSVCYNREDNAVTVCEAEPATVVSTVGAGDSFGAAFFVNLWRNGDIPQAMRLASKVSAYVVAHREAVPEGTDLFLKTLAVT